MTNAGRALDGLIAGLRGHPAAADDWQSVLALANRTLLTPALCASLASAGQLHRIPQDVREYILFVRECNRERNSRLQTQLREAVAALNGRGIVPLLLKGAIPLFLSPSDRLPDRMTSDLDLGVEAADETAAQACLADLGYVEIGSARGLGRVEDAGILELKSSRPCDYERAELVQKDELRARIPTPQSRAMHWFVHDLLKEGDYWRGRMELRHLHDLAQLWESGGVDWAAMRASMPDKTARNALDTQLLALRSFFGTEIPAECARPLIRIQHWRRVFTARHPVIGVPLRLAGNLAWGMRRLPQIDGLVRRRPASLARRITRILLDEDLRSKI